MIRTISSISPRTLQTAVSPGCYQLAHTAVLNEPLTSEVLKVRFPVFEEISKFYLSVPLDHH
jgi:hypothetical protein